MGLLSNLFSKKESTPKDVLDDPSCIREVRYVAGAWHQYDFVRVSRLQQEGSMLGVGGVSRAAGGVPVKIVWIN